MDCCAASSASFDIWLSLDMSRCSIARCRGGLERGGGRGLLEAFAELVDSLGKLLLLCPLLRALRHSGELLHLIFDRFHLALDGSRITFLQVFFPLLSLLRIDLAELLRAFLERVVPLIIGNLAPHLANLLLMLGEPLEVRFPLLRFGFLEGD